MSDAGGGYDGAGWRSPVTPRTTRILNPEAIDEIDAADAESIDQLAPAKRCLSGNVRSGEDPGGGQRFQRLNSDGSSTSQCRDRKVDFRPASTSNEKPTEVRTVQKMPEVPQKLPPDVQQRRPSLKATTRHTKPASGAYPSSLTTALQGLQAALVDYVNGRGGGAVAGSGAAAARSAPRAPRSDQVSSRSALQRMDSRQSYTSSAEGAEPGGVRSQTGMRAPHTTMILGDPELGSLDEDEGGNRRPAAGGALDVDFAARLLWTLQQAHSDDGSCRAAGGLDVDFAAQLLRTLQSESGKSPQGSASGTHAPHTTVHLSAADLGDLDAVPGRDSGLGAGGAQFAAELARTLAQQGVGAAAEPRSPHTTMVNIPSVGLAESPADTGFAGVGGLDVDFASKLLSTLQRMAGAAAPEDSPPRAPHTTMTRFPSIAAASDTGAIEAAVRLLRTSGDNSGVASPTMPAAAGMRAPRTSKKLTAAEVAAASAAPADEDEGDGVVVAEFAAQLARALDRHASPAASPALPSGTKAPRPSVRLPLLGEPRSWDVDQGQGGTAEVYGSSCITTAAQVLRALEGDDGDLNPMALLPTMASGEGDGKRLDTNRAMQLLLGLQSPSNETSSAEASPIRRATGTRAPQPTVRLDAADAAGLDSDAAGGSAELELAGQLLRGLEQLKCKAPTGPPPGARAPRASKEPVSATEDPKPSLRGLDTDFAAELLRALQQQSNQPSRATRAGTSAPFGTMRPEYSDASAFDGACGPCPSMARMPSAAVSCAEGAGNRVVGGLDIDFAERLLRTLQQESARCSTEHAAELVAPHTTRRFGSADLAIMADDNIDQVAAPPPSVRGPRPSMAPMQPLAVQETRVVGAFDADFAAQLLRTLQREVTSPGCASSGTRAPHATLRSLPTAHFQQPAEAQGGAFGVELAAQLLRSLEQLSGQSQFEEPPSRGDAEPSAPLSPMAPRVSLAVLDSRRPKDTHADMDAVADLLRALQADRASSQSTASGARAPHTTMRLSASEVGALDADPDAANLELATQLLRRLEQVQSQCRGSQPPSRGEFAGPMAPHASLAAHVSMQTATSTTVREALGNSRPQDMGTDMDAVAELLRSLQGDPASQAARPGTHAPHCTMKFTASDFGPLDSDVNEVGAMANVELAAQLLRGLEQVSGRSPQPRSPGEPAPKAPHSTMANLSSMGPAQPATGGLDMDFAAQLLRTLQDESSRAGHSAHAGTRAPQPTVRLNAADQAHWQWDSQDLEDTGCSRSTTREFDLAGQLLRGLERLGNSPPDSSPGTRAPRSRMTAAQSIAVDGGDGGGQRPGGPGGSGLDMDFAAQLLRTLQDLSSRAAPVAEGGTRAPRTTIRLDAFDAALDAEQEGLEQLSGKPRDAPSVAHAPAGGGGAALDVEALAQALWRMQAEDHPPAGAHAPRVSVAVPVDARGGAIDVDALAQALTPMQPDGYKSPRTLAPGWRAPQSSAMPSPKPATGDAAQASQVGLTSDAALARELLRKLEQLQASTPASPSRGPRPTMVMQPSMEFLDGEVGLPPSQLSFPATVEVRPPASARPPGTRAPRPTARLVPSELASVQAEAGDGARTNGGTTGGSMDVDFVTELARRLQIENSPRSCASLQLDTPSCSAPRPSFRAGLSMFKSDDAPKERSVCDAEFFAQVLRTLEREFPHRTGQRCTTMDSKDPRSSGVSSDMVMQAVAKLQQDGAQWQGGEDPLDSVANKRAGTAAPDGCRHSPMSSVHEAPAMMYKSQKEAKAHCAEVRQRQMQTRLSTLSDNQLEAENNALSAEISVLRAALQRRRVELSECHGGAAK